MLTTTLAKIRKQFGLAPDASLSQIDAAIDAATTPPKVPAAEDDEGAAAGAKTVEAAGTSPATEAATETPATHLSREDVQAMINTATAAQAQAVVDLNAANEQLTEANASLSARLKVVEGQDAADHTKGKKDPVEVKGQKVRAYRLNPINQ